MKSNENWITMITKQRNFNPNSGEYLKVYVGNYPSVDADFKEGLGVKQFFDDEEAENYAEWLHDKFDTQDLIEEIV